MRAITGPQLSQYLLLAAFSEREVDMCVVTLSSSSYRQHELVENPVFGRGMLVLALFICLSTPLQRSGEYEI